MEDNKKKRRIIFKMSNEHKINSKQNNNRIIIHKQNT